jgi:hypothetical protein
MSLMLRVLNQFYFGCAAHTQEFHVHACVYTRIYMCICVSLRMHVHIFDVHLCADVHALNLHTCVYHVVPQDVTCSTHVRVHFRDCSVS